MALPARAPLLTVNARSSQTKSPVMDTPNTAVFGVSITGDFVWDDRALTVNNGALAGSAMDALSTPFLVDGTGAGAYWRPVVTLALWTQVQVFGDVPSGYHLVNLLLHGGITLLVFGWLRRRIGEDGWGPWL